MEAGHYALPPSSSVSSGAVDMLRGLLCPSPAHRLNIDRIMEHPWFKTKLPPQVCTVMDAKRVTGTPLRADGVEAWDPPQVACIRSHGKCAGAAMYAAKHAHSQVITHSSSAYCTVHSTTFCPSTRACTRCRLACSP